MSKFNTKIVPRSEPNSFTVSIHWPQDSSTLVEGEWVPHHEPFGYVDSAWIISELGFAPDDVENVDPRDWSRTTLLIMEAIESCQSLSDALDIPEDQEASDFSATMFPMIEIDGRPVRLGFEITSRGYNPKLSSRSAVVVSEGSVDSQNGLFLSGNSKPIEFVDLITWCRCVQTVIEKARSLIGDHWDFN